VNCKYNETIRIHGSGSVGICSFKSKDFSEGSPIFVCDTKEICDECKSYLCKHTQESVETDFKGIIRNPSVCGKEYPKLAILLWVLEGDTRKFKFFERIKANLKGLIHGK